MNYDLIKSDKNYRSYYLKRLTFALYILYMPAYQMNFHFKNSQRFWWILNIYRKMCQFKVYTTTKSRAIFVCFVNIIISLCTSIGQLLKVTQNEIDTSSDKQSRYIKNSENVHFKKWLFESLNNNWRNFYQIWSNEVPISSQEIVLSECLLLFHIFLLKFATVNE